MVLLLVGLVAPPARAYGPLELELDVHDEINRVRQGLRLRPLTLATDLSGVARGHSRDMAEQNYFEHEGLDGRSPFDRIRAGGITYQVAAENLVLIGGRGIRVAPLAAQLWVKSPGHYRNIQLPGVTESGVGAWTRDGTVYVTQLFLLRPQAAQRRGATVPRPPRRPDGTVLGERSALLHARRTR